MKKIITYIILFFIATSFIYSQASELELGKRYLKLVHTYLKAKNYPQALSYINEGLNIVVKGKDKYWEAVGYEFLGYYFLDAEKNKKKAMEYLNKALLLYKDILNEPGGGSTEAVRDILERIQRDTNEVTKVGIQKKCIVINLENRKLKTLPGDVPPNVENLSLADNMIKEFPSGLLNFKDLEYLNLENNKIKSIPNEIRQLKNLVYLNLSNNSLKTIPNGLAELQNLRVLELKGNQIPFEDISNLIRVLPCTNILFDKYIIEPEEDPDEQE